jgi:hypothetical protein
MKYKYFNGYIEKGTDPRTRPYFGTRKSCCLFLKWPELEMFYFKWLRVPLKVILTFIQAISAVYLGFLTIRSIAYEGFMFQMLNNTYEWIIDDLITPIFGFENLHSMILMFVTPWVMWYLC